MTDNATLGEPWTSLSLGERIRRALGVPVATQADLARSCGLSYWKVNKIVKGERKAKPDEVVAIAQALGLEPLALPSMPTRVRQPSVRNLQ